MRATLSRPARRCATSCARCGRVRLRRCAATIALARARSRAARRVLRDQLHRLAARTRRLERRRRPAEPTTRRRGRSAAAGDMPAARRSRSRSWPRRSARAPCGGGGARASPRCRRSRRHRLAARACWSARRSRSRRRARTGHAASPRGGLAWGTFVATTMPIVFPPIIGLGRIEQGELGRVLAAWVAAVGRRALLAIAVLYVPIALVAWWLGAARSVALRRARAAARARSHASARARSRSSRASSTRGSSTHDANRGVAGRRARVRRSATCSAHGLPIDRDLLARVQLAARHRRRGRRVWRRARGEPDRDPAAACSSSHWRRGAARTTTRRRACRRLHWTRVERRAGDADRDRATTIATAEQRQPRAVHRGR